VTSATERGSLLAAALGFALVEDQSAALAVVHSWL